MNTEPLAALLPRELSTLSYKPLFIFQIEVKPPSIIGATPGHDRRIGEIAGGRFEGERLRGKILSGGSDWQSLRDRKSTRLNSSHSQISYAVFCLNHNCLLSVMLF